MKFKIKIFPAFLSLFLVCLVLENLSEPLRYLKYTMPALAFIVYFFRNKVKANSKYLSYFSGFLIFYLGLAIYFFLKALFFDELQVRFFANTGFTLLPLLFIFFLIPFFREDKIKEYVKLAFFFNILIFLWREAGNIFHVLSNLGLLKEAVLSSTINTENALAYAMGIFLFYFITECYPKIYIFTCAIIFILCFKRIAIGGFIISYLYYYLSTNSFKSRTEKYKQILVLIGVAVNLLFIKCVFLIVNGDIDKIIHKYTGISTNHLLMGRQELYKVPVNKIGSISWTGVGPGRIDLMLLEAFGEKHPLHSDILNNYFEFGAILFVVWLVLLFYKTSFSNKAFSLLIYFNVMMFTDNVFIYFDFMFYFYFFILIFLSGKFYREDDAGIALQKISGG